MLARFAGSRLPIRPRHFRGLCFFDPRDEKFDVKYCKPSTQLAQAGCKVDAETGALTPPIHFATTFERDKDLSYEKGYVYSRVDNPTRHLFEETIAQVENGQAAAAFASGSAAATAIFQCLPRGAVLMPDDLYHGNRTILSLFKMWGLHVETVDMTNLDILRERISFAKEIVENPEAIVVWTESPSNPLLKITDLHQVSMLCSEFGAIHVTDATWVTPALCRPLDLGCDIVLHSTTKYLGGHSDVLGGVVVCGKSKRASRLFLKIRDVQATCGAVASPFDCWLTLRGMRSLAARMKLHSSNALAVATFLENHPMVENVYYPGLPNSEGHETATKQMSNSGYGGMISFTLTGGESIAIGVVASTNVFKRATSLGGTESLIEHRASVEDLNTKTPKNLLRISIGLEDKDDLIQDLSDAMSGAEAFVAENNI
mmetsp:Transcript_17447/g.28169  ORF Transcript_17447/g.28169 Transcript_17447/m.28169 type:complete len:429 (-) Transcript_17447:66-1352(-)|eukprot:CAMPEP_0203793258 /NCGR_PEP_ID=MMETSP0100_2-20121128/5753_1 /ASSEMBLY_ACC=CAM_ASM_000210 /TAXON_ID=96639 /ORGANISM=" , Strain NY0313808BC1" /LENGTH=428 /DNA_ID=CAMNT_0050696993 /DNA_START=928 /DNA_END=2214 /DNA_ORIENTATION=-